ncbi:hypothetical protein MJO29_003491 [Puccinia striiformis f. sp. tritici]|nr:hypothetical protein MJO29_003491 [Puccinia striiformis f. sp. tritici]
MGQTRPTGHTISDSLLEAFSVVHRHRSTIEHFYTANRLTKKDLIGESSMRGCLQVGYTL